MRTEWLVLGGIALIVIGVLLVIAGSLLASDDAEVRGGGVVFIGPIPIVFGSDRSMAGLAFVIGAVMVILTLWYLRQP